MREELQYMIIFHPMSLLLYYNAINTRLIPKQKKKEYMIHVFAKHSIYIFPILIKQAIKSNEKKIEEVLRGALRAHRAYRHI